MLDLGRMDLSELSMLIQVKLPDAVVLRIQSNSLWVSWQGRTADVEPQEEAGFRVSVALRPIPNSSDSVPAPHLVDFAEDAHDAAEKIAFWLRRAVALDYSPNS
jgi:hypothetical protein